MNENTRGKMIVLKEGERYAEPWLLNHGKFSLDELDGLVDAGYLIRMYKAPDDFMADNVYMLTEDGKKFAWK